MPAAILHIGAHKTGTTSIQEALSGYDDGQASYAQLAEPNHSILFQTLFQDGHLWDHWSRLGLSREAHAERLDLYRQMLRSQLRRDRSRIIFSGENISLLDVQGLGRLKTCFENCSCGVQLIYYVRNPVSWTASVVQENVKHAYFPDDHVSLEQPLPYSPAEKLANAVEVFGRDSVSVFRYEDALASDGDVVRHFCRVNGLQPEKLNAAARANQSLAEETFKLLLSFFRTGVVHNKGAMLEEARVMFITMLDDLFTRKGRKPLDASAFAPLVNWEAFRRLNAFLEKPYDLSGSETRPTAYPDFASYCADLDAASAAAPMREFLESKGLAPSVDCTLDELVCQVFYHAMREHALRPLQRQNESLQQCLDDTRRQLAAAEQQIDRMQAAGPWGIGRMVTLARAFLKRLMGPDASNLI